MRSRKTFYKFGKRLNGHPACALWQNAEGKVKKYEGRGKKRSGASRTVERRKCLTAGISLKT